MSREFAASAELSELLSLFASGEFLPSPDAPTAKSAVIFIRDTDEGLELFMTRQSAARGNTDRGRWSFPAVELSSVDHRRLPLATWGGEKCQKVLNLGNASLSLGYFAAAGRVALANAGLLMANDVDGELVNDIELNQIAAHREALRVGRTDFPTVLQERELRFRPDLFRPWMRFVNIAWQLRRFDTVYFLAAVPPGQQIDYRNLNDAWGGWMKPGDVLERVEPSSAEYISVAVRLICESLAVLPSVGAAMVSVRSIKPIHPEVVYHDNRWWSVIADDETTMPVHTTSADMSALPIVTHATQAAT